MYFGNGTFYPLFVAVCEFHPDVFKAIQKDYEVANFEIGTSVGFTIKPVQAAPIWLLFGPGIVMNGEFVDEEAEDYYPDYSGDASVDPVEREKVFDTYTSLSGEVGVLGKIWQRLALKYTFQYRFPLSGDYKDKITKTKHAIGIGICF